MRHCDQCEDPIDRDEEMTLRDGQVICLYCEDKIQNDSSTTND